MRMLLLLMLVLNAAIAGYYLAVADAPVDRRPVPGRGTLTLVSEGPRQDGDPPSEPSADGVACWQSGPVARGEPLQATVAAVDESGLEQLRLAPVSSGYAVRLARVATIQEAAAQIRRLREAGVKEPRVRPSIDGGLTVVSGRFDTLEAARAHVRALRERGVEGSVMAPEADGDAVRIFVRGPADSTLPPGSWAPVNCQAAER